MLEVAEAGARTELARGGHPGERGCDRIHPIIEPRRADAERIEVVAEADLVVERVGDLAVDPDALGEAAAHELIGDQPCIDSIPPGELAVHAASGGQGEHAPADRHCIIEGVREIACGEDAVRGAERRSSGPDIERVLEFRIEKPALCVEEDLIDLEIVANVDLASRAEVIDIAVVQSVLIQITQVAVDAQLQLPPARARDGESPARREQPERLIGFLGRGFDLWRCGRLRSRGASAVGPRRAASLGLELADASVFRFEHALVGRLPFLQLSQPLFERCDVLCGERRGAAGECADGDDSPESVPDLRLPRHAGCVRRCVVFPRPSILRLRHHGSPSARRA